jgi:hypothetical protein
MKTRYTKELLNVVEWQQRLERMRTCNKRVDLALEACTEQLLTAAIDDTKSSNYETPAVAQCHKFRRSLPSQRNELRDETRDGPADCEGTA